MVKLTEQQSEAWTANRVEFIQLQLDLDCTPNELAEALGIRMPEHMVSARHVHSWWPLAHVDAVLAARDSYEAGAVEMSQGRVGDHMILYAIPRKKPAKPRRYFSLTGNGIEE